jgi:hypothetical protein
MFFLMFFAMDHLVGPSPKMYEISPSPEGEIILFFTFTHLVYPNTCIQTNKMGPHFVLNLQNKYPLKRTCFYLIRQNQSRDLLKNLGLLLATLKYLYNGFSNHLGNNTWLNSSTCEASSPLLSSPLPPPSWQWKSTHILEKEKKGRE